MIYMQIWCGGILLLCLVRHQQHEVGLLARCRVVVAVAVVVVVVVVVVVFVVVVFVVVVFVVAEGTPSSH